MSRHYYPGFLQENHIVTLESTTSHHISRVLRATMGDTLILFNGEGDEYLGTISHIDKKNVSVQLQQKITKNIESPLNLILAQGISRGEKMDFTIQKAVELGVKKIIPLVTERCNVKLDTERREKRLQHWQGIIVSACEQCGRNELPKIVSPQSFDIFLKNSQVDNKNKLILTPHAEKKLTFYSLQKKASVVLCMGPEGGFSDNEIVQAQHHDFLPLCLGPRILRTETAAIAALSILQFYAGDMG